MIYVIFCFSLTAFHFSHLWESGWLKDYTWWIVAFATILLSILIRLHGLNLASEPESFCKRKDVGVLESDPGSRNTLYSFLASLLLSLFLWTILGGVTGPGITPGSDDFHLPDEFGPASYSPNGDTSGRIYPSQLSSNNLDSSFDRVDSDDRLPSLLSAALIKQRIENPGLLIPIHLDEVAPAPGREGEVRE